MRLDVPIIGCPQMKVCRVWIDHCTTCIRNEIKAFLTKAYLLQTDMIFWSDIMAKPSLYNSIENNVLDPTHKENLGIIVQYRVRVRLVLGFGASDVSVELPFTLAHPKPPPEDDEDANPANGNAISPSADPSTRRPGTAAVATPTMTTTSAVVIEQPSPTTSQIAIASGGGENEGIASASTTSVIADSDFSNLANPFTGKQPAALPNDDLIFEDFARLRLRGQESSAGTGSTATVETSSSSLNIAPSDTSKNPFPTSSSTNITPTSSQ
ncbi:unnamed protein product [Rodentolepis nana]|uniref:Arrestin_C domain-containing protein n=1 Tax=Rodentolepis nana TaxID=102285 RepID=A0A0R3TWQ3_RODNA|nr:unnamed protein product [Rodentolepis nana]